MAKRLALLITLLCASCVSYVPQDFMSASATKSVAPHLGSMTPIQFAGDLSGDYSTQNVLKWRNKSLDAATMGAPTDAQIPIYVNGSSAWKSTSMSGDVTMSDTGVATVAASAKGITQLTGDVTAGPGSGSQAATVGQLSGFANTVTVPASTFLKFVNAGIGPTARSGDIRLYNNGVGIVSRNAGDTLDANLINFDASANLNIGQAAGTGVGVVFIQGNSTQMYFGGGANYFDGGPINFRGAAHSSSLQIDAATSPTAPTFSTTNTSHSLVLGGGNLVPAVTLSATGGAGTANTSVMGSTQFTTRSITGNLTIDTTTKDKTVIVDTSSGPVSVTLPAPTNGREIELIDKKSTWGTNNLTLVRSASEKIDNVAASRVFSTSGARCKVWSDGTDWYTGC